MTLQLLCFTWKFMRNENMIYCDFYDKVVSDIFLNTNVDL